MNSLIEQLLTLQNLCFKEAKPGAQNRTEQQEAIRAGIPESSLRTFDRFLERNKKAIAVVRNGVCGGCHLQLPVGALGALAFGHGLQQCGNCGRFLYLPLDEPAFKADSPKASKKEKTKKKAAPPQAD